MKRFIAVLTMVFTIGVGLTTVAPAQAAVSTPASSQAEQSWKMGARPASSTICLANGIAGYSMAYVMDYLTDHSSGLHLYVGNRCDGYSITNRMTITSYVESGTTCSKYTNTGRVWDGVQGKYIWNQNPVIWVNHSDFCLPNDTARAHRYAMYVEYILGISYEYDTCNATIDATPSCINAIKYATPRDVKLLNGVYGLAA